MAWVAAGFAIAGFWTAGIANNFIKTGNVQETPNAAAVLNIVSVVGGVAMLIVSFAIS